MSHHLIKSLVTRASQVTPPGPGGSYDVSTAPAPTHLTQGTMLDSRKYALDALDVLNNNIFIRNDDVWKSADLVACCPVTTDLA